MPKAFIVVGANFGDEGKGMTVCKTLECMEGGASAVFRFNGGCQAGHTVQYKSKRIVNQTLNSATFASASVTNYTPDVVVNPYVIWQESELMHRELNISPRVVVTSQNPWSCTFDVLANRAITNFKGGFTSCGHGINETLRRHEVIPIDATAAVYGDGLLAKMKHIQEYYIDRLTKIGIPFQDLDEYFTNSNGAQVASKQLLHYATSNYIVFDDSTPSFTGDLLFEGAQGLMLDQEFGEFPFVTPSNTGILNAVKYLNDNGMNHEIQPIYCTRVFSTRHGDGAFNESNPFVDNFEYTDATNVTNKHQGRFKLGILDIDVMTNFIERDMKRAKGIYGSNIHAPQLSVSHLDIFNHTNVKIIKNGIERIISSEEQFVSEMPFSVIIRGRGADLQEWE